MTRALFCFVLPSDAVAFVVADDEAHARAILRRTFCEERRSWAESPRIPVVGPL